MLVLAFCGPACILPLSKERHRHPDILPRKKWYQIVPGLYPTLHRASEAERHQWEHWNGTEGFTALSKSGGSMGHTLEVGCSS